MPTIIHTYQDRALLHAGGLCDFAGSTFSVEGYLLAGSNDSAVLVRRRNPSGTETGAWTLTPPAGYKLDDVAVYQAGADLLLVGSAHEISSAPDRRNILYVDALPGVAVPYPAGRAAQGAPTDTRGFLSGADPAPVPAEPVDYARIERLIAAHVDGLAAQFGGGNIRTGIMQKVEDGLVGLMDGLNPDPRSGAYRFLLAGFIKDRLYEVLRDNGLIPPTAADRALGELYALSEEAQAFLLWLRTHQYESAE